VTYAGQILLRITPLFLCLLALEVRAQHEGLIYGKVVGEDQQPVANANVQIRENAAGATSAADGSFRVKVPSQKKLTLVITHLSFQTDSLVFQLQDGERKEVMRVLRKSTTELPSVEVKDQQLRNNSFSRINPMSVTFIPTMNASVEDLVKMMPGVSSRNELSSQYSVRGGNYDENLVFINDIEVYRPSLVRTGQQEGLSIINPDLVSGITFSAGGFDAKYGDKMSSVLDIRYKKPTSFAGSFDVSLLGANAHLEGLIGKKFSYLIGARYKTTTYLLNTLDVKGNYKPNFFDLQGMLNYDISKKWEISLLGTYSINSYKVIPTTQKTTFGTLNEAYNLTVYFDGQELDKYENWLSAATLTFKPNQRLRLRLISSIYQDDERETYDISGEYWLSQVQNTPSGSETITEALGVGAYLNHARNYLKGTVFSVEHRGNYESGNSLLLWGAGYQHEYFSNIVSEWDLQDSTGYSLPRPADSIGSSHPPHDDLIISDVIRTNASQSVNRLTGFLQDTWTLRRSWSDISLTAGFRAIYWDLGNQFLLNPRVNISLSPHWKKDVVFRLSGGYYSQPPTFREMTDLQGNIIPDLKAQTSIQGVLGSDLYFKWWNRPFKFVTEVYYKYIMNLIPYEIDNLETRYYGTNDAHGYATGIDFRINGEFVKGAESWASLGIMKTEEYVEGVWVPRPTDQRLNLSIYFQDYIPGFPTWRVNLALYFGTGLPFGPPDSPKSEQTLRMPPYRRVDLGLSKLIITENTKFSPKNPFRAFTSMWVALEVFNLLDISNTVSYYWVKDVSGREYAVPNYLTPRTINLKLAATF
jgi:hypothetical protein